MSCVWHENYRKFLRMGKQEILQPRVQEIIQKRSKRWYVLSLNLRHILLSFLISSLFFARNALAHCPLCIAATGTAVAFARFYGVQDLVTGTLLGGVIISSSLWLHLFLKKRNKGKDYIPFQEFIILFLSVLSSLVSIYFVDGGISGYLYGLSDLAFGMLTGSFVSIAAFQIHEFLRRMHGNKNYFPFQAIALVLLFLAVSIWSYYFFGVI